MSSGTSDGINDIASWGRLALGIDGKKGKKQFGSFAEEMLLAGINEDEEEDEDEAETVADTSSTETEEVPEENSEPAGSGDL